MIPEPEDNGDDIGLTIIAVFVAFALLLMLFLAISAIAVPPQVNWWMP